MIESSKDFFKKWDEVNNPFYPTQMKYDRQTIYNFLSQYDKQFERSNNSNYAKCEKEIYKNNPCRMYNREEMLCIIKKYFT